MGERNLISSQTFYQHSLKRMQLFRHDACFILAWCRETTWLLFHGDRGRIRDDVGELPHKIRDGKKGAASHPLLLPLGSTDAGFLVLQRQPMGHWADAECSDAGSPTNPFLGLVLRLTLPHSSQRFGPTSNSAFLEITLGMGKTDCASCHDVSVKCHPLSSLNDNVLPHLESY